MADERKSGPADSPVDDAGMSFRDVVMNPQGAERRASGHSSARRRAQLAIAGASLALVLCSAGYFALNPAAVSMDGDTAAVHADPQAEREESGDQEAGDAFVAPDTAPVDDPSKEAGASPSGDSGGDGPSGQVDSAGSGSSSQGGGGQADEPAAGSQKPAPKTVSVSIAVDSSSVGGPVSASGAFTCEEGATVYDALCALGLSIGSQDSIHGVYVSSINGLAEKEHGASSGWMYAVNGKLPNMACSAYRLSDGDVIQWRYVTGQ